MPENYLSEIIGNISKWANESKQESPLDDSLLNHLITTVIRNIYDHRPEPLMLAREELTRKGLRRF